MGKKVVLPTCMACDSKRTHFCYSQNDFDSDQSEDWYQVLCYWCHDCGALSHYRQPLGRLAGLGRQKDYCWRVGKPLP